MTIGLVTIKPVGDRCNLNCRYCYTKKEEEGSKDLMTERVLKEIIKKVNKLEPTPIFFWGGGEPLLAGKDFLKKAIRLQSLYCEGKEVINSLQTISLPPSQFSTTMFSIEPIEP